MFAGSRLLLPVSTNFITLVPETREEGGTRCQRALAAEGDRGAEEIGQQEEAETTSGCPKRWCWSNGRAGGTEGSLPCSWDEEGWLPSERERRSRRRSPVGRSLLPSARRRMAAGFGLQANDPGARQRVFRPTCSSFAPAPPHRAATGGLRYFLLPDLLSTAIPLSSEGSLTACPSFLPGFGHQCNEVSRYGKKEAGTGEHLTHFNNKINKHKLKFQAWSSLVFHCCHSSFNPSEAPPWDSRPVSGAGVVHYQLLHRPRSVPTALGPAPLVTRSLKGN